jgi:hypothetical protein
MTMNASPAVTATPAAAAAQTPPAAAPTAPAERTTVQDRAAALKVKLEEGATSEPAGESSDTPLAEVASSPAASSAAPAVADDAAKRAQDRLERIARVRAKESAAEAERQKREAGKARDGEVEKLRARIAELEPLNDVFKDEESLLGFAEKKGMSSEKLVAYMRARLTDPNLVAQRQAQTVEEKLRAEIAAEREERKKLEERLASERQQAEESRSQSEKTSSWIASVPAKASSHPHTAKLQAKYGNEGLIGFANQFVAPLLRPDYSLDELHDHTEQLLDEIGAIFRDNAAAPTPAGGTSHPPKKNGAGQPATTLSNALTSGRESLVEETPLHKLSRDERKRRLRDKLERE